MASYKSILYHANYVNYAPRNFQVKDVPIQGVTDIAYAFFNLQDSGGGNYVIVSGDTYVRPCFPCSSIGGLIFKIPLLETALILKILPALLHKI